MDKNLRLSIILKAAGNVVGFLRNVKGESDRTSAALNAARDRVQALQATTKNVSAFRQLETRLESTRTKLGSARAEVARLGAAMDATDAPSKQMARGFEIAKSKLQQLSAQERGQIAALSELKGKLEAAGVATNALGAHELGLARDLARANDELSEQARRMEVINDRSRRMGAARGRYDRQQQMAGSMQGAGMSAVGAGVVVAAPLIASVGNANELQTSMTTIAQRSNLSAEATARFERQMRAAGKAANQTREEITTTFDALTAQGFDAAPALAIARDVARASTAYQEDGGDVARAAGSLRNLKIEAGETARSLDVMAVAGKRGNFEFGDMSRSFPSLTAQAEALGMKGVGAVADLAAALQVVRRGAGSSEEAATALGNVMQKMMSPETERRFAKAGINLRKEMEKSAKAGVSPLEGIIELTRRATGGDMSRLGYFFEDAEVQRGLRPLIAATADYRDIRRDALAARGEVDRDFARRMEDDAQVFKAMKIAADDASVAIGQHLSPILAGAARFATGALSAFNSWAKANPALAGTLTAVAAGLATVLVVGGALALGISAILGPWALLQFTLARSAIFFAPLITGLGGAAAAAWTAAAGFVAATWPILAVIAAVGLLVAGAVLLYRNWDRIGQWWSGFWPKLQSAASTVIGAMGRIFMNFHPVGLLIGAVMRAWPALQALGGRFMEMGRHLLSGLVNGVLGGIPGLVAAVMRAGGAVVAAFKNKLGIRSPSRVFAQLGDYTMQGLSIGLGRSTADPLRRMRTAASAITAAGAMAIGTPGVAAPTFDTTPRLAAGGPGRASSAAPAPVTIGTLNLTIVQQPGESADDLVKKVLEALKAPGGSTLDDNPDDYGEAP